jgi:hypothetical protein
MKINNLLIVSRPFIIFLRYSGEGYSASLAAISHGYEDLLLSKTCIYAAGRKRERIY